VGSITIDQARAAARSRLGDVAKGINPKAERVRQQVEAERERGEIERLRAESAYTFVMLVEEWGAQHLAHRKPRYAAEAVRAIHHGLRELMSRRAAQVSRTDAVRALDKITKAGKAEVWVAAGVLEYPWGPFYRLAILTLQRREPVAAMRWPEIAGDMSRWSIPGPKMKRASHTTCTCPKPRAPSCAVFRG
jgi:hypothetical protein